MVLLPGQSQALINEDGSVTGPRCCHQPMTCTGGCPVGGDVIQWLAAKCEEWSERCSEAYRLRATQSRSTPEDGKGG